MRISPGARARRALLVDSVAALLLAALVVQMTAGLGVAAAICLPVLLLGLAWIFAEQAQARTRLRRRQPR
jgi:hypothetical protein